MESQDTRISDPSCNIRVVKGVNKLFYKVWLSSFQISYVKTTYLCNGWLMIQGRTLPSIFIYESEDVKWIWIFRSNS